MLDVEAYLLSKQKLIENELNRLLDEINPSKVVTAMRYSLLAGGKRIRPVLCLSACSAVGGDEIRAMPAACALEMVHTYSLIHDDLPAMDNDALRRGKPTCHVEFDEATAIMAGDGLLTLAFEILAKASLDADASSPKWLKVIQMLASAAGCRGMIEGQMRDMAAEGRRLSEKQLEQMHRLKTGAMIEASLSIGAYIGDGTEMQQRELEQYGRAIGLAFQVADDLLNVSGDPHSMGKAVGTDQDRGKNTYPAILGLAESEHFARDLIVKALEALTSFDSKADPLRVIARYIIDRNR